MNSHALFGIIAGLVAFSAAIPYVWAIIRGTTKPNRITWWILGSLNAMIVASSYALGAWDTLWLPVGYATIFFVYALLSVKYGEGAFTLTTLQKTCVVGAIAAAALWWFSGSALLALVFLVTMDLLGLIPTIYKSYLRPWHEDRTAWLVAFAASVIYILAIEQWTFAESFYPIYVLLSNGLILFFVMRPREGS